MNSKKLTIISLLVVALVAFLFGMYTYQKRVQKSQEQKVSQDVGRLVRMHSPVFGPQGAPVTIVEFFDPACEACRAFYPFVKDLLKQYPKDVRLVIRYAPFHQGSAQVVKLLEASRRQNKYLETLEAVLADQPQWADHGKPNIDLAYKAAARTGLDLNKALADSQGPEIAAVLQQDVDDLKAFEVTKTPTFFVNGRGLTSFGPEQLAVLVAQEVAKARK